MERWGDVRCERADERQGSGARAEPVAAIMSRGIEGNLGSSLMKTLETKDALRTASARVEDGPRRPLPGERHLKMMGASALTGALDRALTEAIERCLPDVRASDFRALRGAAQRRFVKILRKSSREVRMVSRSRYVLEIERTKSRVLREWEEKGGAGRLSDPGRAGPGSQRSNARLPEVELKERFRQLFATVERGSMAPEEFEDQAIDLALQCARVHLDRRNQEQEGRIDVLKRRIFKLMASLERTEEEIARMERLGEVDEGVASIYRTVQGLGPGSSAADQKRAMLAGIFQANCELRDAMRGRRAP